MSKIDHTARLNDQIADKLQAIADAVSAPDFDPNSFEMPFKSTGCRPYNPDTGHAATGTNAFIAMMMGVTFYSTYDGWARLGYQVTDSATFYLAMPKKFKVDGENTASGEDEWRVGGFTSKAVWSFDAVTLRTPESDAKLKRAHRSPIPATPWTPPAPKKRSDVDTCADVEAFISNLGATITHSDQGRAYYTPALDSVTMPHKELFHATSTRTATEAYYSVYLHELTHWTGHKSRCNRSDDRSKRGYAFEELVAEIGAMLMCADLGVETTMRADHVKYIGNWLSALKSDTKYIFSAGRLAQDACNHMHSLQPENLQDAA